MNKARPATAIILRPACRLATAWGCAFCDCRHRVLPGVTGAGAVPYPLCAGADANGGYLQVPNEHVERALYLLEGELQMNGEDVAPCSLVAAGGRRGDAVCAR